MTTQHHSEPLILVIAGHDPSGAAGVQADIETINACGARCASLITATTTQNTLRFDGMQVQNAKDFAAQAELLMADLQFAACKIGLLGNTEIAREVINLIPRLGTIPIVLDPILRTGTGISVTDTALRDFIRCGLLPLCTVITPNMAEARTLTDGKTGADAAAQLRNFGAKNILMTGADEDTADVINNLYQPDGAHTQFKFHRLEGVYHGSGCTLSSSLTAFLASELDVVAAAHRAQEFTWNALAHGIQLGRGQIHPNRLRTGAAPRSK